MSITRTIADTMKRGLSAMVMLAAVGMAFALLASAPLPFQGSAAHAGPMAGDDPDEVRAGAGASTRTGTATSPAAGDDAADGAYECRGYVGLTNRVANCVRDAVDRSVEAYFDPDTGIYGYVKNAIGSVMTLAVIIYGIMLSYGMVERIGRDTLLLLFKVAAVIFFCANSPMIYRVAIDSMDGLAEAAISYIPPSGEASTDETDTDVSQSGCLDRMTQEQQREDGSGAPVVGPWLAVDCLVDTVVGIRVAERGVNGVTDSVVWFNQKLKAEDKGLSRGLMFLFFSGMQSSVFGIILALTGFFFVLGLLMVIVRALFTYLAGYMGVALLVIVSPLIIPLILFNATTRVYFDKWVKLMISFVLQPVIMLVFITFALAAVDFAAFSGKYSIVYRIAGEASRAEGFSLNTYLTAARTNSGAVDTTTTDASKSIVGDQSKVLAQVKGDLDPGEVPIKSMDVGGMLNKQAYTMCEKGEMARDPRVKAICDKSYPILVKLSKINWDKMATARESEGRVPVVLSDDSRTKAQQIAREVESAAIFCVVVVFILNGILKIVPMVAHDLVGDAYQTPDLIGSATGKMGGGDLVGDAINKMTSGGRGGGR